MQYVDCVRKETENHPLNEAVSIAVEQCIRRGILADFFRENKAEVIAMSIFEYDEEKVRKALEEDALERGIQIGEERGIQIGEERGENRGENRLAQLVSLLFAEGRTEDVKRVVEQADYRRRLLQEYHLIR